jgi:iron complex outermembrane recepter protein
VNTNWRVPKLRGVSLDASLSYRGRTPATLDNEVELRPRAQLNLGGRYNFRLAKLSSTLRLQIANLFDARSFSVAGPGAYSPNGARSASGYFTIDL